jgi:type I restriction enzyme S subunit
MADTLTNLGEHIDLLSGFAFKSKYFTQDSKNIPLVKGSNVHQGYVDWVGAVRWPIDEHPINDKYWLEEDDVVLAMDRPWIESGLKFSWIKRNDPRSLLVQRVCRMRGINGLSSRYLRYIIGSSQFTNYIKPIVTGVNVPHISGQQVKGFKFSLPSKATQLAVSDLLENYDNLIENNNRRIAILEDMAQSLYREWFVNFRYPSYADELGASSSNALNENQGKTKLIDSPLGPIPEGWEVNSAAEAITINPKTKLVKEGEKPFVGMSGLSQGSMVIGDIIEKTGNSGAKFINRDTLFARITPCLQNGKTGYVQFLTPEQPVGFGSTEFIVLRESECLSSEFIYLLSRSNNFREHAIQSMTGATGRQRVHNDCFASCYLPVPPKELMNTFTKLVQPMFKSIFNLSKRNENLKQQRDMLLPKLISGQIEL